MTVIEIKVVDELINKYGLPEYARPGDAGVDLRACITEPVSISPGNWAIFPTGIAVYIKDPHVVGFVGSRSGLYFEHSLRVGQGFGTIDSKYTGEVKVMLFNEGSEKVIIEPGEKIAQFIFLPLIRAEFKLMYEFSEETERGAGGFGHTGR